MAHGRVVAHGIEEADAHFLDAGGHLRGVQVEVAAQRHQHVGRPAAAAGGAVAVLGHALPGSGNDERGCGGDIESVLAVAARAAGVDEEFALAQADVDRDDVAAHGVGAAGDLVDGLALHAQRRQIAADLDGGGFAAHDRVHGGRGFVEG